MRRIIHSLRHAFALLRNLGPRRFWIVLVYWILRRYRHVVAALYKFPRHNIKRSGISQDPVLVYQMSKVGSTSLVYSLQYAYFKQGLPNVVLYQAHTLTNLDLHVKLVTQANGSADALALVHEYKTIRAAFERHPDEHWNAISLVRDPIARHVSDYFHHIDRHLPDWRRRWREGTLTLDQVQQSFLESTDHAHYWFDTEIKSVLGVDVFLSPFPYEVGYSLYAQIPKVTLTVIRLEDMDRVAGQAIEQLVGIKQFKLWSFNSASEGDYGEMYKQFKKKPMPDWYIEKAYSSKFACHFYSQAERERLATKWTSAGAGVRSLANQGGNL